MALVDQPLADLVRDVGLGPPDQPAGGNCRDDAIGGMRGHPQQRDLVRILDRPQLPQQRGREPEGVRIEAVIRGQARLEREQVARPQPVRHREADLSTRRRREARQRHHVRVLGLLPGPDRHIDSGPGLGRGPLEARHDEERLCGAGHDEQRQALQGHRAVAGEVLEVRAHADEHGLEPALRGERREAFQPIAVRGGWDLWPGGRDRHPGTSAADAPSHVASVRGPSSNSLR